MKEYGLYESAAVKVQTIKTAIEVSIFMLLSLMVSELILSSQISLPVFCYELMSEFTRSQVWLFFPDFSLTFL